MERLQQDHLGIIATTTVAAAVLMVVLFWKICTRTTSQEYQNVSSPELKQRVAAAAWSRFQRRDDESKAVQKKKATNAWQEEGPKIKRVEQASVPSGIVGGDVNHDNYCKETETTRNEHHGTRRLPSSPKEHKKQHHDEMTAAATTIRQQATIGDQVAWNEERASRGQFGGFSIYGHAPPPCAVDGCCSVVGHGGGDSSRRSSFTPSLSRLTSSSSTGFDAIHGISEICGLPGSDHARKLLQQLCDEFEPVARSRGWSVGKVLEMCCCNSNSNNIPIPPPNVLGYCVPSGDGRTAHSIHIRLRPLGSCHRFHFRPYSSLVRIMAHELAHVQIQAHNDAFFKLMAELEAERVQCLVNSWNNSMMTISSGRRLGGTTSGGLLSPVIGSQDLKRMAAKAAVKRQANPQSK